MVMIKYKLSISIIIFVKKINKSKFSLKLHERSQNKS